MSNGEQLGRPVRILIVEDNPGDVILIRKGFTGSKVTNTFSVAGDGVEAWAHLEACSPGTLPDLILLDLNLPRMNGPTLLGRIRADPRFSGMLVAILTSSDAEEDIVKGYKLQANAYVRKPLDLEQFHRIVLAIDTFFFTVVELPVGTVRGHRPG